MAKAIIFDLDGVIVDTERSVWHAASVALLKLYHKKFEREQVGPLIYGTKFEDATRVIYEYYAIPDTFENFLAKRRELVRKGFSENVTIMDGFEDFYKGLKNYKTAIATSMDTEFLKLTLQHLPLRSFFGEHIYTIAESGGRGKPHPDIFLYAAKKLHENPADCIVIEDAPKGITAAKNAGMKTIGLATSVTPAALAEADHVVGGFAEITKDMLA